MFCFTLFKTFGNICRLSNTIYLLPIECSDTNQCRFPVLILRVIFSNVIFTSRSRHFHRFSKFKAHHRSSFSRFFESLNSLKYYSDRNNFHKFQMSRFCLFQWIHDSINQRVKNVTFNLLRLNAWRFFISIWNLFSISINHHFKWTQNLNGSIRSPTEN